MWPPKRVEPEYFYTSGKSWKNPVGQKVWSKGRKLGETRQGLFLQILLCIPLSLKVKMFSYCKYKGALLTKVSSDQLQARHGRSQSFQFHIFSMPKCHVLGQGGPSPVTYNCDGPWRLPAFHRWGKWGCEKSRCPEWEGGVTALPQSKLLFPSPTQIIESNPLH